VKNLEFEPQAFEDLAWCNLGGVEATLVVALQGDSPHPQRATTRVAPTKKSPTLHHYQEF